VEKLQEHKPIRHAVTWILMYILIVNIGDNISGVIGGENFVTVILLVAFSIALLLYLKKNNWFSVYGFKQMKKADFYKTLFYMPLILTLFIHYFRGINKELGYSGFFLGIVLMICVGFIEELLFRGFLYKGILKESGMTRAIIISGVTFGIGHIVNLLRGYSIADQINQIVIGIFIGIVLALLVAVTDNIIPCVIYHMLFNIGGTITNSNLKMETYMVLITLIVCTFYSFYLMRKLKVDRDYDNNLPL